MTIPSIVQFLAARLQEDEDTARATLIDVHGSGDWRADDQPVALTVDLYRVRDVNARPVVEAVKSLYGDEGPAEPLYVDGEAIAAHVARHDPARVLREIEAKRKILLFHQDYARNNPHDCIQRAYYDLETYCWTIQHLAAAYSDHPDYREEWTP
jgi:hypothetical protein